MKVLIYSLIDLTVCVCVCGQEEKWTVELQREKLRREEERLKVNQHKTWDEQDYWSSLTLITTLFPQLTFILTVKTEVSLSVVVTCLEAEDKLLQQLNLSHGVKLAVPVRVSKHLQQLNVTICRHVTLQLLHQRRDVQTDQSVTENHFLLNENKKWWIIRPDRC